ncbi:MAG: pyridoxal-dependent decarboxylase [Hyphomicrobium sp.]
MVGECMNAVLDRTDVRLRAAHRTHLGYPYNLLDHSPIPPNLYDNLINNLGDPYVGSRFGSDVYEIERDVIAWLREVWQCHDGDAYWGSIAANGTDANMWALYFAREALPSAVLVHSVEAHHSIPTAARMLQIETMAVPCDASGAISIQALSCRLESLSGRYVIVALTCGTASKGAHDNIADTLHCLEIQGFNRERRFVHVDGALSAMVLPFVKEASFAVRPSFAHEIDSISTCGHKMIGAPMPCGVLVVRRQIVKRLFFEFACRRSTDAGLMGSRNGHAILALWARLKGHGVEGFTADVARCQKGAQLLIRTLRGVGAPCLRNDYALTVVFPEPCERLVRKYQLAVNEGMARAIVMPNVTEDLIQQFGRDYGQWWSDIHEQPDYESRNFTTIRSGF